MNDKKNFSSKLTAYEKETTINFNKEEDTANIFTYDYKILKKLKSIIDSNNEQSKEIKVVNIGDEWGSFIIPKKWIKVSPPKTMNISEERKIELSERLKNIRKVKNEEKE